MYYPWHSCTTMGGLNSCVRDQMARIAYNIYSLDLGRKGLPTCAIVDENGKNWILDMQSTRENVDTWVYWGWRDVSPGKELLKRFSRRRHLEFCFCLWCFYLLATESQSHQPQANKAGEVGGDLLANVTKFQGRQGWKWYDIGLLPGVGYTQPLAY